MSDTQTPERQYKAIRDLEYGDHITRASLGIGDGVRQVRAVEPTGVPSGAHGQLATILFAGGTIATAGMEYQAALATESEIATARAEARRDQHVAGLHRLADLIEDNGLDLPDLFLAVHVGSRDELDVIAKAFGVPVTEPGAASRGPVCSWDYPGGQAIGPLRVYVQSPRVTEPEPAAEAPLAEPAVAQG